LAAAFVAVVAARTAALLAQHQPVSVERASAGSDLAEAARGIAASLDRGLFERRRKVRLIAEWNAVRDPGADAATLRPVLHPLQASLRDTALLLVIGADGTVLATGDGRVERADVGAGAGRESPSAGDVQEASLPAPMAPGAEPVRFVDFAAPAPVADGSGVRVVVARLHRAWAEQTRREITEPLRGRRAGAEAFVVGRDGAAGLARPVAARGRAKPAGACRAAPGPRRPAPGAWRGGDRGLHGPSAAPDNPGFPTQPSSSLLVTDHDGIYGASACLARNPGQVHLRVVGGDFMLRPKPTRRGSAGGRRRACMTWPEPEC